MENDDIVNNNPTRKSYLKVIVGPMGSQGD
jgi:hypothetical protein